MSTSVSAWLRLLAMLLVVLAPLARSLDAADAAPPYDFKKEMQALRKQIEEVRGVLDQATSSAAIEEKKQAIERFDKLKAAVQSATDRAVAAGKTEDQVTEYLERFQFASLSKLDRDLRATVNEAGAATKPKE